jgi:hypothetical protein
VIDRHPTDWVIQGQETLSFRVARDRKLSLDR